MLDTAIPPRRLGRALRRARRACGLRLRAAAARLDVPARRLRAWEQGRERVPPATSDAIVGLYGEQVTRLVPARATVRVDVGRVEVGEHVRIAASTARDDVLRAYVDLVAAVRGTKPGAPLTLRTDDLVTLASTLGREVDDIEARIVAVLDCTRAEAATLHAELRRRCLVPAAGLAVSAAAFTGAVALAPEPDRGTGPRPLAGTEAVATEAPLPTGPIPASTTAPVVRVPAPAPSATTPGTAAAEPVESTPAPPAAPATDAPETPAPAPAPPPTTTPAPAPVVAAGAGDAADPTNPPVTIPPGEVATDEPQYGSGG
jgi:hypothetical protein